MESKNQRGHNMEGDEDLVAPGTSGVNANFGPDEAPVDAFSSESSYGREGPSNLRGNSERWTFATAYFNFLADFRERHRNEKWPVIDFAKRAASAWHSLSDAQKRPYQEAATRNRQNMPVGRKNGKKSNKPTKKRKRARKGNYTDSESDASSASVSYKTSASKPTKKKTTRKCILNVKPGPKKTRARRDSSSESESDS